MRSGNGQALDDFFKNLGDGTHYKGHVKDLGTAAAHSLAAAKTLTGFITGSSFPDPRFGFDAIVDALFKKNKDWTDESWAGWTGPAAHAFTEQVQEVRKFGMDVAALFDYTANGYTPDYNGVPTNMQYEVANSIPIDFNQVTTSIQIILSSYAEIYTHATTDGSGKSYPEWTRYLFSIMKSKLTHPTASEITVVDYEPFYTMSASVPTFEEWTDHPTTDPARAQGSGQLNWKSYAGKPGVNGSFSFIYKNGKTGGGFAKSYALYSEIWPGAKDQQNLPGDLHDGALDSDYYPYLNKLATEMGGLYQQVKMPPTVDSSKLPQPQPQTSPGGSGGPNTQFPSFSNPGSSTGGGFVPPGSSTLPVPSFGSTSPGGTTPGSFGAGSAGSAGGAFDPSQLASFGGGPGSVNGGQLGSGFGGTGGLGGLAPGGAFGTASAPGVSTAGVLGGSSGADGAGGAAGLAAECGFAGAAGTAGRSMMPPMYPMGGMGAGKDGQGRQRGAYLSEDEDVWGASTDGGSAVL